ncbi:hypothetical protein A8B82_13935 [Sulfitobacter sp. EhC04]|uniref:plasmid replication protein RepC n=1 Tax=Sulfitobacter sp. EhC04 TaxID=1849168 RepID=UPI0007F3E1CB|nr:plasmid replication protein RepC [Sulfitobacter sp. EhC04]OAN76829.1 hypothetical protein A8B82_13935 [Sulfitobacter sp. EhC04]
MEYTPVSSFRRPITAVQLERQAQADRPVTTEVSKWDALRKLAAARQHFNLSDRDLTVLQALLGFHPETALGADNPAAVVYPSNKAICERLNGMPCSTMRRHIARLVDAGVILRRDSPNGKRYVRRNGGAKLAYGFDLTPLAHRFEEFSRIADRLEEAEARRNRLREMVSLMRRDLAGYVEYGITRRPDLPLWDQMSDLARLTARDLRRKLGIEDLTILKAKLVAALEEVIACIDMAETPELSTSDAEIEQHHQSSNKEYIDKEKAEVRGDTPREIDAAPLHQPPPLSQVLSTCKEIQSFSQGAVRHWEDLIRLSDVVSPMMGIGASVWQEAKCRLGRAQAAATLAAMLERFSEIKSPSAYLRSLGQKAGNGLFSCGPMIRALEGRGAGVHSCEHSMNAPLAPSSQL